MFEIGRCEIVGEICIQISWGTQAASEMGIDKLPCFSVIHTGWRRSPVDAKACGRRAGQQHRSQDM